jgi:hypothetical protein
MGSCDMTEAAVLKRENLLSLLLVVFFACSLSMGMGKKKR